MRNRGPVRTVRRAAAIGAVLILAPGLARAQRSTLARDAALAAGPGGRVLATMAKGTAVEPGASSDGWTRVTMDGWIATSLTGAKRDSFELSVTSSGARLRAAASTDAALVASLQQGLGLHVVARDGKWVHVRRVGWVLNGALQTAKAQTAKPQTAKPQTAKLQTPKLQTPKLPTAERQPHTAGPQPHTSGPQPPTPELPTDPSGAAESSGEPALTPSKQTTLALSPDGHPLASLAPGAVVSPIARDRNWVKVRVEGWVRASDLVTADPSLQSLSAADLRADPEGTKGRVLHWTVQKIQLSAGDGLRRDIHDGEPYLLARGPGDENALLYITVPPELVSAARALPAMSNVVITARVRTGRSDPSGVPVLELMTIGR